uniref:Leucine zipper protein 1 n=1 Tax=Mola mola TaxID=94237 RepID=A0A3Q3W949_MOLML
MREFQYMTHRHLRHKLHSFSRRLDELEEATSKLQKSEDELLDLQDKIIQVEGSNSSLLGEVEVLRKNLLKIQGKDEEVRKAEDLCRTVREKLEEEENLTKELRAEIERLQRRMAELEKLEEAFGKSKSDCSQLCLSLNEEKNMTKKLSSELEALKARLKEMEGSETKLERAEQALAMELEKLKGFTQTFMTERKRLLEKQREDEKIILKLTEKMEHQKHRVGMSAGPGHADFIRSRIEDELSSTGFLTSKLSGRKKSLDYLKMTDDNIGLLNKSENEKNSGREGSQEEDNKVKELTQEVERLKNRLKQLEIVEEDLKCSETKNGELHDKFQMERNRTRQLSDQVEQLRAQLPTKVLENGKAENEEIIGKGFRQEKPKYRSAATVSEPSSPKYRNRELSPQHKRETKLRSRELSHSEESSPTPVRRALSPAHKNRRMPKTQTTAISFDNGIKDSGRGTGEKTRGTTPCSVNTPSSDIKKVSVLSRYPPAANDQKPLRTTHKQTDGEIKKNRAEKLSKLYIGSDSESNNSDVVPEISANISSLSALEKDTASASDQESGSEGHSSASETESTGSRPSEPETVTETPATTVGSGNSTRRSSRYSHVHDSHSEDSSTRGSFDEELHSRTPLTDGGIDIQRVCSPREALRSKAVIKPAIVEIDRKEMMISESLSTNGKPKISSKPIAATTSKMTSSITIYPNDPSSSRTSSRSSSVSSEPLPLKERHTSTSNIVIGKLGESTSSHLCCQRSNFSLQSSYSTSADLNDTESGFESSSSSTTTVTSWRRQRQNLHSQKDSLSDMKNVTVRSTWRNRGTASVDETGQGRGGTRAMPDGGSEDEAETASTWRAYRATTFDTEEMTSGTGGGSNTEAQRGNKPSPAEVRYIDTLNNVRNKKTNCGSTIKKITL